MTKKLNDGRVLSLLLGVAALFSVALVVQMGHTYDETEHLHVAWLMGKLGQRPLDDFFQHHMPLLWDVLKIYFWLGFDGPEVLYFGRFLVVLSTLTAALGWLFMARLLAPSKLHADYATAIGFGSFVLLFLMQPDILVIRPESLAIAPWVLACLCWLSACTPSPRQNRLCFFSGALYCAALFFSPRMLFLIGWLALLSGKRPSLKQAFLWVLGALFFALAYLSVGGCSLRYLYFALEYSSKLQKIGGWETPFLLPYFYTPVIVTLTILWILLIWMSNPKWRKASWLHLGYLGFTFLVGWSSSYPHIYLQNFLPSYLSTACSMLVLGSQAGWESLPAIRQLIQLWLAALCFCLLLQIGIHCQRDTTIFYILQQRHLALSELAPTDTVLVCYQMHPIVVRDASYYGPWLGDSQNRMGEAIATVQDRFGLPPCDYVKDLKASRPRLVDTDLDLAVPENDVPSLRAYLSIHYDPVLWNRRHFPLLLVRREAGKGPPGR